MRPIYVNGRISFNGSHAGRLDVDRSNLTVTFIAQKGEFTVQKIISAICILALSALPIFADYKISQKVKIQDVSTQTTTYVKGVRQRVESNIMMDDPEMAAMMEKMMPRQVQLSQCDLKQNVTLNEEKKQYFIDYYDWSGLSPEQQKRRPNEPVVIKGTTTMSAVVTDSGRRQKMFGYDAKWLKFVQTIENSEDSCNGKSLSSFEQEGWFIDLKLSNESCQVPQTRGGVGGCRPKLVMKGMQNPGFFLEGTTRIYDNGKLGSTMQTETTALSTAPQDQALFEIPKDYTEVDSLYDLTKMGDVDTSATSIKSGSNQKITAKTVAIDFFSGNASKVKQDELRAYVSQKVEEAGFSGYLVTSQAEIATGNFANVIGIELKKVKESGASKIGGLFGKVTGAEDAAKMGQSEAEVAITIYGKDGKTVVATGSATEKLSGKAGDAVKAAIDRVLSGLLVKIK